LSQVVASSLGALGSSIFVSATCASSLQAISQARCFIRSKKDQEIAVVGSDFSVTPFIIGSLKALGVYAKQPASLEVPYQPWDDSNHGMMLGEGSMSTIVCGSPEGAFAEILGAVSLTEPSTSTGLSCEFVSSVLRTLLLESGVLASDINVYLAHGSGTAKGDSVEEEAVISVFGSLVNLSVETYKSLFGHLLGCSGLARHGRCMFVFRVWWASNSRLSTLPLVKAYNIKNRPLATNKEPVLFCFLLSTKKVAYATK